MTLWLAFWHWLTWTNEAAAVQAVAAVIATMAAVGAAIFAYGAYQKQSEQLVTANTALRLTREQYQEERKFRRRAERSATEEREARRREAFAADDEERPRFAWHTSDILYDDDTDNVELVNSGKASARRLVVFGRDETVLHSATILRPKEHISFALPHESFRTQGIRVVFRTKSGARWALRLKLVNGEVVETRARYKPAGGGSAIVWPNEDSHSATT